MNIYYCESGQFADFLSQLKKECKVFSPAVKDPQSPELDYYYQLLSEGQPFLYNAYRPVEPLKSFFTYPYEEVAGYFRSQEKVADIEGRVVVFGVKSCDIFGHKVQDFVFLEGVEVDSLYRLRRENTVIISGDCTDFKQVCHCLAWDVLPYPTDGFDLSLAPLGEGYLIEVGSAKGEELLQRYGSGFVSAKDAQLSARNAKRKSLVERLKRHILPQNLVSKDQVQKLVRQGYASETWSKFMLTCVECGGCNLICDTCHCFLLAEKKERFENKKLRVWDSCLYANYARVAGGANPLKTRSQRLRNRFMKKFDFFVDNLGIPACCGCGRCIEVCPGKIDIREVLKDLAQGSKQAVKK